uniref:Uncharacterized protein n=1 Tax=Quercus lobata TaxID=97700 RepID=A0A7N2M2T1_QUELO
MEQEVVSSLQKLCLTKEEEAEISITAHSRADLLEECSLSLFGRLLSDRQQNQRALKSTLRAAWKMGSELRIIEGLPFELMSEVVGRDIGNSMGRFIEIDKRANQSEQAKFLRIRVDLPIDKPLRRGGNIVGMDDRQNATPQYGDWLRANGMSKGGSG